jgi:hypothetical protein
MIEIQPNRALTSLHGTSPAAWHRSILTREQAFWSCLGLVDTVSRRDDVVEEGFAKSGWSCPVFVDTVTCRDLDCVGVLMHRA